MLSKDWETAVVESFKEVGYQEIYGLNFSLDSSTWSAAHQNVAKKFLTANEGKIPQAKTQLIKTLKWRQEFKPLEVARGKYSSDLEKLGVVTQNGKKVVTWNLYGAIKNPGEVFGNVTEFLKWRVGLHERALALLDFADEKHDKMDQVHDYMNVSFLRLDSRIKKASKQIIEVFQSYYPETLSAKYFVNVPYVMMWVFKLVQSMSSQATVSKFTVLSNGSQLAEYLGPWVPESYGGKGKPLKALAVDDSVIHHEEVE